MSAYAKSIVSAIVAVLYATLVVYQSVTGDGLQLVDLLPVLIALFGALLTYVVPNVPQLPWAKAIVNGALTVLAALSQVFASGTSGVTLVAVLVSVAGALAVYQVPNSPGRHAAPA
jgi:hypothetical protein